MPPTFLDSSWRQLGGKIAPESNEFMDPEKSSFFWTIYTNFWLASLIWIFSAAVLLLEFRKALRIICPWTGTTLRAKMLYESFDARFPLTVCYKELLYEVGNESPSLQAIWIL